MSNQQNSDDQGLFAILIKVDRFHLICQIYFIDDSPVSHPVPKTSSELSFEGFDIG